VDHVELIFIEFEQVVDTFDAKLLINVRNVEAPMFPEKIMKELKMMLLT
jgi:hypothetical protein